MKDLIETYRTMPADEKIEHLKKVMSSDMPPLKTLFAMLNALEP